MEVILQQGRCIEWSEFCALPGPVVALDGFVAGPSRFSRTHMTFDHHDDCNRLVTRTTAEQVFRALVGGCPLLDEDFTVYISEVNPGVALAVWTLMHWDNIPSGTAAARLRSLIEVEAVLNSTNGVPAGLSDIDLAHFAWLFESWVDLQTGRSDDHFAALEGMLSRIGDTVQGAVSGCRNISHTYNILGRVGDVVVVEELHPFARAVLALEGESLFVSVRNDSSGGKILRFGALNPWACVDMESVYKKLNAIEGVELAWGGNDSIGGSPKLLETSINPMDVAGALSYVAATGGCLSADKPPHGSLTGSDS